jgi:hypothetical protein
MNDICIIHNNGQYNIIRLDFKTDTFKLGETKYPFEITDKSKILLHWSELNKELYYSDDSYLYFSNIIMKTNFKKIFLINRDWYDQALYVIDTGELKRIKNNDQHGTVIDNSGDKFIINWNHWGTEEFTKLDEYNYIVNDYKYNSNNKLILNNSILLNNVNNIHIFIHVCTLDGWKDILKEQLNLIKDSGLYNITTKIHFGIVGDCNVMKNNEYKSEFNDTKYNILYIDSRIELYELNTINYIKYMCTNGIICKGESEEAYILYIHTKGVRNAGNPEVTASWRNMMQYFLIGCYKECINNLEYYDALGNNCVNMGNVYVNKDKKHCYHYSGNFWWSKKSHIDKLDYLDINGEMNNMLNHNIRYLAENWILSKYPDGKYGVLFQDDTNTHPYHRYVFEYYKGCAFNVKDMSVIK